MPEKFKFNGVLERKKDPRDYGIARFVPQRDRRVDKEEFCLPLPETQEIVMNQFHIGACVGHGFASAVKLLTYQRTHKWVDIDPFVIYGTRNEGYRGTGMYLRDAAMTVNKEGAFLRRDFGEVEEAPEIIDMVTKFKAEHPDLVEKAKDFCVEGYAWLDERDTDEIKTALLKGMPVVCSYTTRGGNGFSCDQYGYVIYPRKGSTNGLHCMVIIGWTKDDHWIVLNSWGTNRGHRGILYIDFRETIQEAIAVSDTICPIKKKATYIALKPNSKEIIWNDGTMDENKTEELEVATYIDNSRMYVPVRFISNYLGAAVEWDAETGTANIVSEEHIVKVKTNERKIFCDGITTKIDVVPQIRDDRMFLPIRYVAESLNCVVGWDEQTGTATITCG